MADVILIQPTMGKGWNIISIRPPNALLAIASIPHTQGYNIKVLDQRIDHNWKKTLKSYLKSDPLCVGITTMTGQQIRYALEAARMVKENSSVPVVFGGPHATLLPIETLENRYVDIVVGGEGDVTFYELLQALEKRKPLDTVRGIHYKQNGRIKSTPLRPFVNLDELPLLPYDLIDATRYNTFDLTGEGDQAFTLSTSRGCPFRCAFCHNTAYNYRRWRGLGVERSIEVIKHAIDSLGLRVLYFEDDNICGNLKRFKGLIDSIIKEKLDILWGAGGIRMDSIEKMDVPFLKRVEKSGCRNLDIGVESGSPRMLKLMKKDETLEQMVAGNRKLARFPFIYKYTFVIGGPTETEEELRQTVKFSIKLCRENKSVYPLFPIYTPYPGTEMFKLGEENGLKAPKSLEGWSEFNSEDWFLKFPSWLTKERIDLLTNINFAALFANRNIRYKITNKPIRMLFDMYQPIAKHRFEHSFYPLFIEKKLVELWRGM